MTVTLLHPPTDLFDDQPVTVLSDEQLGQRLTGYAGQIAALTARFLELLAEFDTRRAWSGHGILSCAHWLCWRTGMSLRTAHEHVRIAHALTALPRLRAAFGNGELTYSKIRALTRIATPDRERELLHVATSATAAQVERLVRSMRTLDQRDADTESRDDGTANAAGSAGVGSAGGVDSSGRWGWNDDGTLSVTLKLAPLDGAAFLAGVVRAEYERTRTDGDPDIPQNALHPDPATEDRPATEPNTRAAADGAASERDLWRCVPFDIAPAVRVMADTLRTVTDVPGLAPTAEVIVHTHHAGPTRNGITTCTNVDTGTDTATSTSSALDASAVTDTVPADGDPVAAADRGPVLPDPHLDDGPALSDAETAEAVCGATVSDTRHETGVRLWWGRRRRIPTRRLVEFIVHRDRCCQHPGCGRTRHLHLHHVRAWSAGGSTDPDNLIVLCSAHHRALHRGEYRIHAHGAQRFTFHQVDGTLLDPAPPLGVTGGWRPDPAIPADATVPVNGGRLDLGYTTDVLYRIWDHHQRRRNTPSHAA